MLARVTQTCSGLSSAWHRTCSSLPPLDRRWSQSASSPRQAWQSHCYFEEVNVGLSPAVLQVYGDRGPLLRGTVSRVGGHVVTHHSRLWAQSSVQVFPSLKLPHFTTTKIVNRCNVLYTDWLPRSTILAIVKLLTRKVSVTLSNFAHISCVRVALWFQGFLSIADSSISV